MNTPDRLSDFVFRNAAEFPEREALVSGDVRYTWAETADMVERCSRAMLACGIRRGDRVAMLSTPRPEYVVVLMAAMRIGAVWLGINPRFRPREIEYVLRDADPNLVFCLSAFEGRDFTGELEELGGRLPLGPVLAFGGPHEGSFAAFLARADEVSEDALVEAAAAVDPADPAVIIYTSGTTGEPKGAVLSSGGFVYSYSVQARRWPAEPLRIVNNMPISHIGGVGDITAYAVIGAGTMIFMERFDPDELLDLIARERVTVLGQVTAMVQRLVSSPKWADADLSSLQFVWWAGSEAPVDLVRGLRRRVPHTATYYGMSELTGSVTYVDAGADDAVQARTIGRPAPEFEVRLAGPSGEPVSPGESGEIQVRGPNVLVEYWRQPDSTGAAFTEDGWFRTGDLGRVRSDGNWEIVGRLKEMYKSGGYNVYPREVERVLEAHPDVDAACVVAVPDPDWHEVGCAFVRARAGRQIGTATLNQHMRGLLANYKVPKSVVMVEDWPVTASGKIDRQALAARAYAQWTQSHLANST